MIDCTAAGRFADREELAWLDGRVRRESNCTFHEERCDHVIGRFLNRGAVRLLHG
jgi:hypothetical protein